MTHVSILLAVSSLTDYQSRESRAHAALYDNSQSFMYNCGIGDDFINILGMY